jgi:benzil reductase ((S)-benzoin forming)
MKDKKAFITGVSSGIGLAMANKLLDEGYFVYGCSRTIPRELNKNAKFKHFKIDLSKFWIIKKFLEVLFKDEKSKKFDLVFLNAGIFGAPPNLASKVKLDNFQNVLDVNLTANKIVLDYLINKGFSINTCLISSSIAGVRLRAGTLSYAVSKAALNALIKIYALENPKIFFALIGLCNVDTKLSKSAISGRKIKLFPELVELKRRFETADYISSPEERAQNLYNVISNKIKKIESGCFIDIRTLLNKKQ